MSGPPIFQLKVVSHDVACEIRVNDVPVLRLPSGRAETTFDVNPHVHTGDNTLELRVRRAEDKHGFGPLSSCTLELSRRESPRDQDAAPVTELRWEVPASAVTGFESTPGFGAPGGPVADYLGLAGRRSFALATPFSPWFWRQAPVIPATEATRAEVLAAYRAIHAQLAARDVAALERACAQQAGDWQVAYALPDLAAAQRLLGIASTLGDPDVEVEDFPEDALTMELLGDGRLVQLVDADGKSPLRLRLRSTDEVMGRFNVVLCKPGADWVIAR